MNFKGVQEKKFFLIFYFFYGLVSTHLTPKPQYFVWLHLIRGTKKQFKFILYMNRTKEQLDQYISLFFQKY